MHGMHAPATCGHRMVLCRPGRGCRAVLATAGLWVAGAGAAVVRRSPAVALRQRAMGGRHAATKPGTDLIHGRGVARVAGPASGGGHRRGWPVRWRLPVAWDDGQDRPALAAPTACAGGGAGSGCSGGCRRQPARRAGVASGAAGPGIPHLPVPRGQGGPHCTDPADPRVSRALAAALSRCGVLPGQGVGSPHAEVLNVPQHRGRGEPDLLASARMPA